MTQNVAALLDVRSRKSESMNKIYSLLHNFISQYQKKKKVFVMANH
jgi:hypothetical protein